MWNPGLAGELLQARQLDLQSRIDEADQRALNAERAKEALAEDHPAHPHHLRSALAQVERAIAKLHEGSYGRCDDCGAAIAADRLAATPEAVRCGDCA